VAARSMHIGHSRREADPGKTSQLLNLSERLLSANATAPVNHPGFATVVSMIVPGACFLSVVCAP
jgi:hypothetical protein